MIAFCSGVMTESPGSSRLREHYGALERERDLRHVRVGHRRCEDGQHIAGRERNLAREYEDAGVGRGLDEYDAANVRVILVKLIYLRAGAYRSSRRF